MHGSRPGYGRQGGMTAGWGQGSNMLNRVSGKEA